MQLLLKVSMFLFAFLSQIESVKHPFYSYNKKTTHERERGVREFYRILNNHLLEMDFNSSKNPVVVLENMDDFDIPSLKEFIHQAIL